jgi:hypothetical protein
MSLEDKILRVDGKLKSAFKFGAVIFLNSAQSEMGSISAGWDAGQKRLHGFDLVRS